jgi:hypothetical protein
LERRVDTELHSNIFNARDRPVAVVHVFVFTWPGDMLERPCSAWLWLLLLLVFDVVFRVDCFNLDMRWPIVKRGELDSYFGYSVAGHQSLDENGAVNQSW